jgi:hypothetical protein
MTKPPTPRCESKDDSKTIWRCEKVGRRLDYVVFSNSSFASLTFVARYGLPPRSGWFKSMSERCFLRIMSFVRPRSL